MSEVDIELYKPAPVDRFADDLPTISNAARLLIGGSFEVISPEDGKLTGDFVLHAIREIDRLRIESQTDHLTGLKNRKALPAAFYEHGIRAVEYQRSFVCLFGDLQKLKRVNDLRGHKAGDEYLVGASRSVLDWAGKDFEVFRWGGDELSLVGSVPFMRGHDFQGPQLQSYRSSLQSKVTDDLKAMCVDPEIKEIIGLSVGAVIVSPDEVQQVLYALHIGETTIDEIVEVVHDEADKSMYKDKLRDNKEVYDTRPRTSPFVLPD